MCDSFDRGEGEISITSHGAHPPGPPGAVLLHCDRSARGDELTATVTKTGVGDELTQPRASTGEFSPCSWVE